MSEALVPVPALSPRPTITRAGAAGAALPEVIVDAGPAAVERFLEFFAAQIANARTRAAYGRAAGQFLAWCAARGLGLRQIAPLHVAAYIRTHPGSAPTVTQHLAAIRSLCDWLVVSQVLPVSPAAAVRGPKHVVTKGATPGTPSGSPGMRRRRRRSCTTGRRTRYRSTRSASSVPGPRYVYRAWTPSCLGSRQLWSSPSAPGCARTCATCAGRCAMNWARFALAWPPLSSASPRSPERVAHLEGALLRTPAVAADEPGVR